MDAMSPDAKVRHSTQAAAPASQVGWRPDRCDRIALILQGGGALGAYQAGVYEALHEAGVEPDWVTGVSIGAINCAIIAGNPRNERVGKLRDFWTRITERSVWLYTPDGDIFRQMRNATSAFLTTLLGQPGFFEPNRPGPWLSFPGATTATAYYDTSPLRQTLTDLVDFDRVNDGPMRLAVGAVNVLTGNFNYFDTANEPIGVEHIMASGALPPAFPSVKIGTDYYWDGGIVSNTPLQHLLSQEDSLNSLVFQVDLFSARGELPRSIEDVMSRHKDIMYSSRTRLTTDLYRNMHALKGELYNALKKIPKNDLTPEEKTRLEKLSDLPELTILHLIYQQKAYEGHAKDYEFSAASMRDHWQSGFEDTKRTLKQRDWLELPPQGAGILVHDVHRLAEV
jgi:NTE family protein